jgi:pimeloyl-ACP methyl ester carboxylesterase
VRQCFVQQPSASDLFLMLGYNLSVPPHVRQALFSRAFDNDDLLPRIRKPALITQGGKDAFLTPELVDQHKSGMTHAQIHIMPNAGHSVFWDDAPAFNQRLREFVEMCTAVTTANPAVV